MKNEMVTRAVEEFKKEWFSGMESLLKASQTYVKAIDSDEKAKELFKAAFPKMSNVAWSRIESVGREQMHYTLLCDTSAAAEKVRKLPYSDQKAVIESGVDVLTVDGTTLKVKTENLTAEMSRQAIARDHVRTVPEQKAYIESLKTIVSIEAKKPKDLWQVKNRLLQVHAPTAFTRQQLINILQDIG